MLRPKRSYYLPRFYFRHFFSGYLHHQIFSLAYESTKRSHGFSAAIWRRAGECKCDQEASPEIHNNLSRRNNKYGQKKEGDDEMNGCPIFPRRDEIEAYYRVLADLSMSLISYGDQRK
ncbi:hypothetical protein Bca4012_058860 [Brassica carinata]